MFKTKNTLRYRTAVLMAQHNVRGFSVRVGHAPTAWAHCDYRAKEIVLDSVLQLMPDDFVEQAILHELAHALRPKAGHSREWLSAARAIGYTGGIKMAAPAETTNRSHQRPPKVFVRF